MKRGGYDDYGPDEVLKRARERGENVGWDRCSAPPGRRRKASGLRCPPFSPWLPSISSAARSSPSIP
jgi:hypothetical protein